MPRHGRQGRLPLLLVACAGQGDESPPFPQKTWPVGVSLPTEVRTVSLVDPTSTIFLASASLPPNMPGAELTVFPFFLVNFGPSAFHLMPQGFEQPPGLGGSGLAPVTVNGRMVACNPAGTEFLLSTDIVPQVGDYECDGPYPPLAKKVATQTLTPTVAAACRRWYTKFGFSDELRIAYDENQYLVALKASPTSHDLSERLNTALQLAEDAQRFRVQHHPIPYASAQANWSAWLLSVLRIGASYGLWDMAATKGHYDAPANDLVKFTAEVTAQFKVFEAF